MNYDVRCLTCDSVYVSTLDDGHTVGETVRRAHVNVGNQCGEYGPHEIVGRLSGAEG